MGKDKEGHIKQSSPARLWRNRWRGSSLKLRRKLAKVFLGEKNRSINCPAEEKPPSRSAHSAAHALRDCLKGFLATSSLTVAVLFRSWLQADSRPSGCRNRDLFPIPVLTSWPQTVAHGGVEMNVCLDISNMCIAALNALNTGLKLCLQMGARNAAPSRAQHSTQCHVCRKVVRHLTRLNQTYPDGLPWKGSFGLCESGGIPSHESLRSDDVDLPQQAASCDAYGFISAELAQKISMPAEIFPGSSVVRDAPHIDISQRVEYIRLTVREVACGKLRLRRHVEGLGGVFAVAKKGGRQRKIWDGSKVSESAAVPPKPRRLANPSSFLDLQIDPGTPVFFSKRDASTFFDTLKVPPALQTWFGQPPITMQEFQQHGLEGEALRIACDDCDHNNLGLAELLFPVHAVWPMGFSWSSAVAQDTTLATCVAAGIAEEHILSLDHDIPQCHDEVCFVATDDTVLVHTDARKGRDTLANLDRAFESHGILRNASKDISLAPELTALGCDLSNNPVKAEPNSEKMGQCICRTLDLLHRTHASPRAVHGLLGVWEWFALLQRGFFSIYDSVYQFVRKEPADCVFPVPGAVLNEMLVSALLAPLLSADLDRLVLPKLVATDAAPEFGFGVSACECNIREATQVCRLSERRGDYVRLTSHPGDVAEMPRLGVPRKLGCTQKDFVTIICSKAKWPAHSGVLEAHACLLALKWLARRAANHHHKIPLLVDAKVVIGAVAKGRSSSRALRTILRSVAAITMGANVLPRTVYIPSESNPADLPSRGRRNRPLGSRPARKTISKQCTQPAFRAAP